MVREWRKQRVRGGLRTWGHTLVSANLGDGGGGCRSTENLSTAAEMGGAGRRENGRHAPHYEARGLEIVTINFINFNSKWSSDAYCAASQSGLSGACTLCVWEAGILRGA